ncbi:MAG: DNA mismatch endonuclease Vsr [Gemmatimonadota bacterium]|nr:DNA mismatch endonuclease Vsr [Gemmatimonadota bacterium]
MVVCGPELARSELMRRVRRRDTKPEIVVRSLLHRLGYRFRLQASELPGRPDIVFRRRRKAIFVHGCFWHRHKGCNRSTIPKTRRQFWIDKFEENCRRDEKALSSLEEAGWKTAIIWECETKDIDRLELRLASFLEER